MYVPLPSGAKVFTVRYKQNEEGMAVGGAGEVHVEGERLGGSAGGEGGRMQAV